MQAGRNRRPLIRTRTLRSSNFFGGQLIAAVGLDDSVQLCILYCRLFSPVARHELMAFAQRT